MASQCPLNRMIVIQRVQMEPITVHYITHEERFYRLLQSLVVALHYRSDTICNTCGDLLPSSRVMC